MNLFLGGALAQLFQAIRKLTIMVHMIIINVRIPANTQIFFSGLLSFVTFNIINLEPYLRKAFRIDESMDDVLLGGMNFDALGYPSNYLAINIGNLVFGILFFVIMIALRVVLNVKNKKLKDLRSKLTDGIFWNEIIQFITETYMILSISTFTNLFVFHFNSFGTTASSNMTMIALPILLIMPIFALTFLLRKRTKLAKPSVRSRFLALYETLAYKREGVAVLFEPFVFYTRILMLAAALLFLQGQRAIQIVIAIWLSVFMVMFVGLVNPYTTREKTFFEQFNEFGIMIIIYHLMCFADTLPDIAGQIKVGWSMILFIIFNLFVNISYVLFTVGRESYLKLRLKYYTWKLAKLKK
jgi:hypothetical protein